MLGLHLVWCLWFSQKPIFIQDAREGVERLYLARNTRVIFLNGFFNLENMAQQHQENIW